LPAAEAEIFNQLQPQDIHAPTDEPLNSAEQLALCFIHKDDRANPYTRLQRYEAHLQRSLSHCYKHLRALQEYRHQHPRTYDPADYAPQPGHPIDPEDSSDLQIATTNNQPQTTNGELQNEPISPVTPAESDKNNSDQTPPPPPPPQNSCACHNHGDCSRLGHQTHPV